MIYGLFCFYLTFDDDVKCMETAPDTLSEIVSQMFENGEAAQDDEDESADTSFNSATSDAPDDPSPSDVRRALKTLQSFASKHLFGVAPMDALMKLEICITDAKIDGLCRNESELVI